MKNDPDIDVSLVALEAAIEIDNVLLGRRVGVFDASRKLSVFLRASFVDQPDTHDAIAYPDFWSTSVFSSALEISNFGRPSGLQQLLTRAREITDDLADVGAVKDKERLKELRDFCIALSDAAGVINDGMDDTAMRMSFA